MDWYWSWSSNTWPPDAKTWLIRKTPMLQKIEGRRTEDENRDGRAWDGWMASPPRWAWAWASCRSWWTRKPCVLQSMGSQRFGHHWVTELNWGWLILVVQYLEPHLGRFKAWYWLHNLGLDSSEWSVILKTLSRLWHVQEWTSKLSTSYTSASWHHGSLTVIRIQGSKNKSSSEQETGCCTFSNHFQNF